MSVFRSDDGREIDEADLRLVVELADCPSHSYGGVGEATTRVLAALAQKPTTCGAYIKVDHMEGPPNIFPCILPPGHHPLKMSSDHNGYKTCCAAIETDPIHAPGHMPSADSWVVPNG